MARLASSKIYSLIKTISGEMTTISKVRDFQFWLHIGITCENFRENM